MFMFVASIVPYHPWSSILMFTFFRVKNRVIIVWHMIYDHRCLCLCLTNIVSYRVFVVWHIIYYLPSLCLSVFIVRHMYDWWLSLFMFLSARDIYRVINVRHIIHNHRHLCLCSPEINAVSEMFDISSKLIVVYACVFHSFKHYFIVRHMI